MRRTPVVLAVAAAGLLVAACGSTVSGTATVAGSVPASSSATGPSSGGEAGSAPSGSSSGGSSGGDLTELLLGSGDFPAGYRVAPVDTSTLAKLAQGIEGLIPGLTVTPPECARTNPYSDLSSAAGVTGSSAAGALVVVEIIGPADAGSLGLLRATLGRCAVFRATFTGPDGKPLALEATSSPQQAPPVDADDTLGLLNTSTADVGTGSPLRTSQSQLYAQVGGTLVGVALSSVTAAPLDQAVVDAIFTAAVAKVRAG